MSGWCKSTKPDASECCVSLRPSAWRVDEGGHHGGRIFGLLSSIAGDLFSNQPRRLICTPCLGARYIVTKTGTAGAYKEVQDPRKPGYYQKTGGEQEADKITCTCGWSYCKTAVAKSVSDKYNRFWSIRAGSVHKDWVLQTHGQ